MFFILSKLLFFLLSPITWCVIIAIVYFITKSKKIKKTAKILGISIIILFINSFLYMSVESAWQINPQRLQKTINNAIVLGGLISFNARHEGFFNGAAERYTAALQMFNAGKIQKIIVSGGSGLLLDTVDKEALFLKEQFIKAAVPEKDILVEDQSRNTFENALYTKQLIKKNQLNSPFVLITSAEHMRRAAAVFQKAGIDVIPYPVNYNVLPDRTYNWQDFIIPNFCNFYKWQDLLKEIIGYLVYKVSHKL